MTNTSLKIEIDSLPMSLRKEVADFVAFLKMKNKNKTTIKHREFGYAKDKIQLSKDFDEPLDLFKEYI
ncbi:MAG: DUF2281 domain-containing protein [Bacteroidia bacterium]|jgi:hypothetical protein